MSLVVNTNVGSLNAQRSLAASGAELKTAMERLSSGKKINSAADDADFAAESARLAKAQVLQQTGTAMLAQANAQPQLVLSLIR